MVSTAVRVVKLLKEVRVAEKMISLGMRQNDIYATSRVANIAGRIHAKTLHRAKYKPGVHRYTSKDGKFGFRGFMQKGYGKTTANFEFGRPAKGNKWDVNVHIQLQRSSLFKP